MFLGIFWLLVCHCTNSPCSEAAARSEPAKGRPITTQRRRSTMALESRYPSIRSQRWSRRLFWPRPTRLREAEPEQLAQFVRGFLDRAAGRAHRTRLGLGGRAPASSCDHREAERSHPRQLTIRRHEAQNTPAAISADLPGIEEKRSQMRVIRGGGRTPPPGAQLRGSRLPRAPVCPTCSSTST